MCGERKRHTDNKIDLRTESKGEILVAHKVLHCDGFHDTHFCDSLASVSEAHGFTGVV
jgi:hypothetical protein